MTIARRKRIGILGGTFDPVHFAHLRVAQEVAERCGLSRVVFVPNRVPPHKRRGSVATASERLHMVRLATRDNARFEVSDFELKRNGPSYTRDTLVHFAGRVASPDDLFFILGTDAFAEIGSWHRFAELFALANFVVMMRPGATFPPLGRALPKKVAASFSKEKMPGGASGFRHESGRLLWPVEVTPLDVSATAIREALRAGRSVRYLTPPGVEAYIRRKKLYRARR